MAAMFIITEDTGEADVYVNDSPTFGGMLIQAPPLAVPRLRWWLAHRAARLALRDRSGLSQPRTADPDCPARRAGARVAGAVGHALGFTFASTPETDKLWCILTAAAKHALGEPWPASDPARLDLERHAAQRAWERQTEGAVVLPLFAARRAA